MSRTRHFLDAIFFGYGHQILVTTTGLWLTPFLLHRIGQRDYGLWLVGLQVLTWLGLTDLGIVALLPRETAYALGRTGSAKLANDLPDLLAKTARIVLWQWPFVASIAATCCFLTYRESADLFGPIAIVAGTFVITFPLRMFRAVLEGLQEFHLIGVVTISSWAVSVAATVALTVQGFHLYALAVGWVTSQLLSSVTYLTCVRVKYPYVFPRQWTRKHQNATRFQFQRGIWISLSQIAAVLIDATDLSIIGKTMGSRSVVPYSCTGKLIGVLTNQPLMILDAASPGLSEIKSGSSRDHAFRVVMNLTQAMLLLSGAVVCVVLAANQGFVDWWVGPQQFAGLPILWLMAIAMLLRHWNATSVDAIFCFGYERRISITKLIDGLLTIGSSLLLVRRLGAVGAPLGSIVGVCVVSLPANILALSRESQKTPFDVCRPLWPWFWRFAILAGATITLSEFWIPVGIIGTGVTALLVGLTYLAVMFPMVLRSPLRVYLPPKFVDQWGKWNNGAQITALSRNST